MAPQNFWRNTLLLRKINEFFFFFSHLPAPLLQKELFHIGSPPKENFLAPFLLSHRKIILSEGRWQLLFPLTMKRNVKLQRNSIKILSQYSNASLGCLFYLDFFFSFFGKIFLPWFSYPIAQWKIIIQEERWGLLISTPCRTNTHCSGISNKCIVTLYFLTYFFFSFWLGEKLFSSKESENAFFSAPWKWKRNSTDLQMYH